MKNNRFAVAIHILSMAALFRREELTSENIAGSVNTNAVVIRRLIGDLKQADLLKTQRGVPGIELTRQPETITLLDIYRAVEGNESSVFNPHQNPNPACEVGAQIKGTLTTFFNRAQNAAEKELNSMTLQDVINDLFSS
ncbi:Rrf2 family transcriptional regulator [Bacillus sp. FJAT-47783]|uniref:Rrf2 family transcriptional regulator n=1 Tax=Bacillus sp. FJAT-47783 TaxID=2922712 RepID=UPI001FAC71A4|nr:Rrf2 family transcriptional regulator [Bacillus sp. FJAT-47783]